MNKRVGVLFLLFSTIEITFALQRNFRNMPLEVEEMMKLANETVKLIDKRFTKDDNETAQILQSISNNFHFHIQDTLYSLHKSINVLQSSRLRGLFISFAHPAQAVMYGISNVNANDTVKVRSRLKKCLEGLIKVLPMAKDMIKQATDEQEKLAVKSATYAYDLALFSYVNAYTRTKYCQESNKRIEQDMEQSLENVYSLLKEIRTGTPTNLDEFVAIVQIFWEHCSKTVEKLERLAYIYHIKPQHSNIVTAVSQNLQTIIKTYSKDYLVNTTSMELETTLKRPLFGLSTEVKKLSYIVDSANKAEEDIYKDILLETFTLFVTFNTKLEILKYTWSI